MQRGNKTQNQNKQIKKTQHKKFNKMYTLISHSIHHNGRYLLSESRRHIARVPYHRRPSTAHTHLS